MNHKDHYEFTSLYTPRLEV